MKWKSRLTLATAAGALLACGDDPPELRRAGEADVPIPAEITSFDPDTFAWFREGRPVEFGGREWEPAGDPVFDPIVAHVGEFEGMPLYAAADATPPFDILFFPVGDTQWQALLPVGIAEEQRERLFQTYSIEEQRLDTLTVTADTAAG